ASALAQEYQAIAAYNNSLAAFEFAKGTIMKHDSVLIGEGPLPKCALVRAVEHERERTAALVLRERENPVHQGDLSLAHGGPRPLLCRRQRLPPQRRRRGCPRASATRSPSPARPQGRARACRPACGDMPARGASQGRLQVPLARATGCRPGSVRSQSPPR